MSIGDFHLASVYEVERIFSDDGVALRVDDEPGAIYDALTDASETILGYCERIYAREDLRSSRWINRRAAYLACYFLSQRRGNPSQYLTRYEHIIEELKGVMEQNVHIPGVKSRNELTPSMSNLIVDDRWYQAKLRVQRYNSTGATYSGQHLDYDAYPYGYW